MILTESQRLAFKAAILADPNLTVMVAERLDSQIRDYYNAPANPAFTAWRTSITRAEIYHQTSGEGTTWDWNLFKAQSVPEQGAWREMFMGDAANMSLDNLRTGVEKIFGAANAQTAHVKAIGKRQATRAERLFATGGGQLATPGKFGPEGLVTTNDISDLLN